MTDASTPPETPAPTPAIPTAEPVRRMNWWWLVPVAAAVVVLVIAVQTWRHRGVEITVAFDQGFGIVAGDSVKYRGIIVGTVRDVQLAAGTDGVLVTLALRSEARTIARAGSRFWVVRPQVGFDGVSGLDTIVGARYIAALPGGGSTQRRFVGLEAPPVVEELVRGDLEIVVECPRRGSLSPGSPVTYRQVPIGSVLAIGLASDASSVEARVHIEAAYAPLIRKGTRFWDAGGLSVGVGLTGFSADLESLEMLLRGGLAVATPPDDESGPPARTGARYKLAAEPRKEWLAWQPAVPLGAAALPPGLAPPQPLRVQLRWRHDGIFGARDSRAGWILPTDRGVLAASEFLLMPEDANESTAVLEVVGREVPLPLDVVHSAAGLTMVKLRVPGRPWPSERLRHPVEPEDALILVGGGRREVPLAPGRFRVDGDRWWIDPAVSVDEGMNGGTVVSREDGAVIGFVLLDEDDRAFVRPVPPTLSRGEQP